MIPYLFEIKERMVASRLVPIAIGTIAIGKVSLL